MSGVGGLRAAALIARKDLRVEWRGWESLSSSAIFAIVVLLLFELALGEEAARELGAARFVPGVLWSAIAFAALVILGRSMQVERNDDTIGALLLAPVDRGALFAGKLAANLVKLTVLQWLLVPLSVVLFDWSPAGRLGELALVLAVHGVGLAVLGTLFAAVTMRTGRGEALLGILLFPALAPLLISAVECTAALLDGRPLDSVSSWLIAAAGFDLLYLTVGLATFDSVVEE